MGSCFNVTEALAVCWLEHLPNSSLHFPHPQLVVAIQHMICPLRTICIL